MAQDKRTDIEQTILSSETQATDNNVESLLIVPENDDQLDLFVKSILPNPRREFSNLIILYDQAPKNLWGEGISEKPLPIVNRPFKYDNRNYKVRVTPAQLEIDGEMRWAYPGKLEALIEEILRMFAADGGVRRYKGDAGVVFTLYALQQELKKYKHTHSINEIKVALDVMHKATVEITDESDHLISKDASSTILPQRFIGTRKDWQETGKNTVTFATFHALVTPQLDKGEYRKYLYDASMRLRTEIGRYLFRRLSERFTSASSMDWYSLHLRTILRDSGILARYCTINEEGKEVWSTPISRLKDNIDKRAIKELKDHGMINIHKWTNIPDPSDKRRMLDYKLSILPGVRFTKLSVDANKAKQVVNGSKHRG